MKNRGKATLHSALEDGSRPRDPIVNFEERADTFLSHLVHFRLNLKSITMSQLRQFCPQCGRTLELPTSAIGRLAKCPACDTTFTVTDTGSAAPSPPSKSVEHTPNEYTSAPPSSPYAPPYAPIPVRSVESIEIVERAIEDVVSPAWNIFMQRWSPLVLSLVIVIVLSLFVFGLPFVVLAVFVVDGGELLIGLGVVVTIPLLILASTYAWIGMTRVGLAVARDEAEPLAQMYVPMRLVWRMLGASLLLWIVSMVALSIVGGGITGLAFLVGGEDFAPLGMLAGIGILTIAGFIIQVLLWPLPFIIGDDKSTAMGAIRIAWAIAMQNKLPSFLLILIKMVLSLVGSSLCYVGLLATQPLTLILFTVAYLLMTRQKVADPRGY